MQLTNPNIQANSSILLGQPTNPNGGDTITSLSPRGNIRISGEKITLGNPPQKNTTTIVKKVKKWKKIICWLIGHKEQKVDIGSNSLDVYLNYKDKTYRREHKVCERCGIYQEETMSYEMPPLTKNEQIIRDIIT